MKKLLPYIFLLVVVLVVLVTIPFLLQTDKRRQQLADELSQRLNRKVVISKMDFSLFPPSFRLSDVAVFAKDDPSHPDLQIESARAGVGLGDLFSSGLHPAAVTLDHWSCIFHRAPNGRWDSADWLEAFSQAGSAGVGSLHQIVLRSGEIHWTDGYAPVPQELLMQAVEGTLDVEHQTARASGSLSGAAVPVTFAFQGQGHFLSGTWSGDLHLTDESRQWALHIDDVGGKMGVTGQSGQWRWDNAFGLLKFYGRLPANVTAAAYPVFLQNWRTQYTADGSSITLAENATLSGGLTEAAVQIQSQASGPVVKMTGAAQNVPLSALCAPVGGCASLEGNLTAIVTHFQTIIGTDTWSAMSGEGTFELQEGRYHLPDASIQKLTRAHLLKYMKKKFVGFPEQGLVFAHMKAHGVLAGGLVTVDDALIDSGDVRTALVGKLDPAHKGIDVTLRLQIHERGSRLELIPGKYIIGDTGREQIQPIYGHLQGTWDEWMLRAVPNYKVSAALKSKLQRALSGK